MEFALQKISDTELSIVYHFTDVQGKVCSGDFSKTMRGSELFIDCIVVPVRGDQLAVFPDRIYTDLVEPIRGLSIINQYNNAGSPSIFTGVTHDEVKILNKTYEKILRKESSQDWFRSSPHISATPERQWYRLVARYRGGIEIVRVKKVKIRRFFSALYSICILLCFALIFVGGYYAYTHFQQKIEQVQTIFKLSSVVRNLKANYPVADLEILSVDDEQVSVAVRYYRSDGILFEDKRQVFNVTGRHIYIDCEVYNFTYSLIETGSVKNIAIPVALYTDVMQPQDAFRFENRDSHGIPFVLYDFSAEEQVQQLAKHRFFDLFSVMKDPLKAQELGIIRSVQKNAVANEHGLRKGDIFQIRVEQTGGIILRQKGYFNFWGANNQKNQYFNADRATRQHGSNQDKV